MKYIVDRIIGDRVVLEGDNSFQEVYITDLPGDIREGSVLYFSDGVFTTDADEEHNRRAALFEKQRRLIGKNKKD